MFSRSRGGNPLADRKNLLQICTTFFEGGGSSVLATIPHAGDAAVLPAPSDWPRRPAGSPARKGNLPRRRPRLGGHPWAGSARCCFFRRGVSPLKIFFARRRLPY